MRVCARTRLSETAYTRKLTALKHVMMKQYSRLASWGKLFLDLLKQGFLTRGAGLMNEKWDICGRDHLFFYSWVVAQTLVISKKVRTRQSICAHRLQKIRGNIAYKICAAEQDKLSICKSRSKLPGGCNNKLIFME